MADDAGIALVNPQQTWEASRQSGEAISLSELSSIRFSMSFDAAAQRIVLHDLTPSTGRSSQHAGRRAIIVD